MPLTDAEAENYLSTGITAREVVRLAWPEATDSQALHVLWEHTPYPIVEGLVDLIEAVATAREEIGPDLPQVDDQPPTPSPRVAAAA